LEKALSSGSPTVFLEKPVKDIRLLMADIASGSLTECHMPEWSDKTRQEYREFMEGNRGIKDPVERILADIDLALQKAWKNNRCQTCPIAELSAIAAAARTLYTESRRHLDTLSPLRQKP
jgi:hypothetical protein